MEDDPKPEETPSEELEERPKPKRVNYAAPPPDWDAPHWPYWDESAKKPKRRRKRKN